jgi:dethiobiotin synthetase
MQAVFITGTDTNVGKTLVSAWLARHWQATYWKPLQSGCNADQATDRARVATLSGQPTHPEAYRLAAPLSPNQAAACEDVQIELARLRLPAAARLVVEGAGGLLAPLNDRQTMAELIVHLDLPVLIIGRTGLGTINHTCLTVEAARRRNLRIIGIVLSGIPHTANRRDIEHFSGVPVLDVLPQLTSVDAAALAAQTPSTRLLRALDELPPLS